MKKIKILVAVTLILAVVGFVQLYFINRSADLRKIPTAAALPHNQERTALILKKVKIDYRLEVLRDRMKSAPNKAQTSRELDLVTKERDALLKEIEDLKAKELKDSQLEAKQEKRENTKMYLTFIAAVLAAISSIIVAIINRKK